MSRAQERWLLAAVLLLGATLRLSHLGDRPLWKDEQRTLLRARESVPALLENLDRSTHPPLYFFLMNGWSRAFGPRPSRLRLFSALCGIGAIAALYAAARNRSGAAEALLAAWVVAVSPIHFYYSQEARSYALLVLLSLASAHFFFRFLDDRSVRPLVACAVATLAALYTHYWSIFLVAFENLFALAALAAEPARNRRPALRRWLLSQGIVALCFLPWLSTLAMQVRGDTGDWIAATPYDALAKTFYRFAAGYGADATSPLYRRFAILPFAAIYLPALIAGSIAPTHETEGERRRRWGLLAYLLLPLALAFAASIAVKPLYVIGRYDLIVFPAFVLLVARGLARAPRGLLIAALAGMATASAVFLHFRLVKPAF